MAKINETYFVKLQQIFDNSQPDSIQCVVLELSISKNILNSSSFFRKYKNYKSTLSNLFSSIYRSLTQTASLWIICDDAYNDGELIPFSFEISDLAKENNFQLKNMIVWYDRHKENLSRDLTNHYRNIVFCVKDPSYTFNLDLIREPHIWKDYEWGGGRRSRYHPKGKNPSNVWLKTRSDKGKILEYLPLNMKDVIERCILLSSDKNDKIVISTSYDIESSSNTKTMPFTNDIIINNTPIKGTTKIIQKTVRVSSNKVINNSSEKMKELPTGSVQLAITSPPYWGLRNYGSDFQIGFNDTYEQYLTRLETVLRECFRVLAPSGSFWINIGKRHIDGQMSLFAKDLTERAQKIGFILKDLVIWHKPIFVPSSGNKNLTDRYEHVIFLTKNKRNYYFNAEALSDVNDYLEFPNNSPLNIWRIHRRIGNIGKKILVVDKGMQIEHTAVYPDELVKRIIVLCSKKNDLILDPFSGSGTTLSTANNLGRRWIGYELNSSFNRLVEWRMKSIS